MANDACSDTGPILHLTEIGKINLLHCFKKILISKLIEEELLEHNVQKFSKNISVEDVNKDQTVLLAEKYDLDIGESSIIYLCKKLRISLMLTDDLDARAIAIHLDLKPMGTLGVVMRAYRDNIINQKEAIDILNGIYKTSSLFVTKELIDYAAGEIKNYTPKI